MTLSVSEVSVCEVRRNTAIRGHHGLSDIPYDSERQNDYSWVEKVIGYQENSALVKVLYKSEKNGMKLGY